MSSRSAQHARTLAAIAAVPVLALARPVVAQVVDPINDFLPTYTAGPQGGDLDVLTASVTFDGSVFRFRSTQAANIGTTPGALYVWGVDRGQGTARFPVIAPGVLFDAVVTLRPDGSGTVNRIVGGGATTLVGGSVFISGATIEGIVPLAALPSLGLDPFSYTVNLWPRVGTGNDNQIADFAPNNSNFRVSAVPEPQTWSLAAAGLVGIAGIAARRRRSGAAG